MRFAALVLAALVLSSCAATKPGIEKRDLEQLYQGAGSERYFLPGLPLWANFSASSNCKRDGLARYLNFDSIRNSYSLSYEEIVHFQHMLNRRFWAFKHSADKPLYLKDEAFIFYNVYEQVAGGGRDFLKPQFKKVSLIWLDPLMDDLGAVEKLLQKPEVLQGHPIVVSACLNSLTLERLSEKFEWNRFGVKLIGQEMFSPYGPDFGLGSDYVLDFSKLLPDKEIRLFAPSAPPHFLGVERLLEIEK